MIKLYYDKGRIKRTLDVIPDFYENGLLKLSYGDMSDISVEYKTFTLDINHVVVLKNHQVAVQNTDDDIINILTYNEFAFETGKKINYNNKMIYILDLNVEKLMKESPFFKDYFSNNTTKKISFEGDEFEKTRTTKSKIEIDDSIDRIFEKAYIEIAKEMGFKITKLNYTGDIFEIVDIIKENINLTFKK